MHPMCSNDSHYIYLESFNLAVPSHSTHAASRQVGTNSDDAPGDNASGACRPTVPLDTESMPQLGGLISRCLVASSSSPLGFFLFFMSC